MFSRSQPWRQGIPPAQTSFRLNLHILNGAWHQLSLLMHSQRTLISLLKSSISIQLVVSTNPWSNNTSTHGSTRTVLMLKKSSCCQMYVSNIILAASTEEMLQTIADTQEKGSHGWKKTGHDLFKLLNPMISLILAYHIKLTNQWSSHDWLSHAPRNLGGILSWILHGPLWMP